MKINNLFAAVAIAVALATSAAYASAPSVRPNASTDCGTGFGQSELWNDGWRFSLVPRDQWTEDQAAVDAGSPAQIAEDFDDAGWREVLLPHDWSVEGTASPSLNSCTGYYPGGIGWYRKTFNVDNPKERLFAYFEGVYNRSRVYLNGHLLGYRPSGFSSFLYDLTPYLREGKNVLAVRADHSREADSRYYTGSGIYRNVYLVHSGPVRFGLWGLAWRADDISSKRAMVTVDFSTVADKGVKPGKLTARATLFNAEGEVVATANTPVKMEGEAANASTRLNVKNPRLWDVESPYLYTLRAELREDGRVIDQAQTRVGLRSLRFDANEGFFLNGRNLKVKGVCLHEDGGIFGGAVPREVWQRRLRNLREVGANALRTAHNPQAPMIYDLADEMGFLVMDEASDEWEFPKRKWVEGWNVGTPKFEGTCDYFEEWIDRDERDMALRDRNHPSVFLWSIGNEVDYPNDPYSHPVLAGDNADFQQPAFGGYNPEAPKAERIGQIAERLAPVIRSVDTSRPVTGALAGVVMSNQTTYPEAVDVVGYNYTESRYGKDHELYPERIIYGSENGQGYDAWKAVRDNDHIFGQFLWTGVDYLGEAGRWPSRGLGTGLLGFDGEKKARGKFRQALWSDKPVTFLGTYPKPPMDFRIIDAPALWNYGAEGDSVRVVVYTNAPQARLTLNGKEIGTVQPFDDATGILAWDVAYAPGILVAEGLDAEGNVESADTLRTSGRPYALVATSDIDGFDSEHGLAHVTVQVVDEEGNPVTLADNTITAIVEGGGSLMGLESADNHDMGNWRDNSQRAFNGRLLAYIGDNRNGKRPGLHAAPFGMRRHQGRKGKDAAKGKGGAAEDETAEEFTTVTFTSPLLQPATVRIPNR